MCPGGWMNTHTHHPPTHSWRSGRGTYLLLQNAKLAALSELLFQMLESLLPLGQVPLLELPLGHCLLPQTLHGPLQLGKV